MRLIEALLSLGHAVDVALTASGRKVLLHEVGLVPGSGGKGLVEALARTLGRELQGDELRVFPEDRVEAPASSGTAGIEGVLLCPCSMGTLARVAAGFSSNLPERAADVALKEGRTLVLVPREAPLSAIHLENMLKLARLGAVLLPAAPGFYHHPRSIQDLLDHVVGKVLDRLGLGEGFRHRVRWTGELEPPTEPGTESPLAGGASKHV